MSAARSGDPAAVTALFRAIWPVAYRIARSMLNDSSAAEDAAQAACSRAFHAIETLRDSERFAPWFYRIVVNEAKQRLRTNSRELPFDTALGGRTSDADAADTHDDRIDVNRAIDALEPGLRAAIVLRYYAGLSSSEIGGVLEVSPVTARWRLMMAHRKLRALLEPVAAREFRVAEGLQG